MTHAPVTTPDGGRAEVVFAIPSLIIERRDDPAQMHLALNFCGSAPIAAGSPLSRGCEHSVGKKHSAYIRSVTVEEDNKSRINCRSFGDGEQQNVVMTPIRGATPADPWQGIELQFNNGSLCKPLPKPSYLPGWEPLSLTGTREATDALCISGEAGCTAEAEDDDRLPSTATFQLYCDYRQQDPKLIALELGQCAATANFTWANACPQVPSGDFGQDEMGPVPTLDRLLGSGTTQGTMMIATVGLLVAIAQLISQFTGYSLWPFESSRPRLMSTSAGSTSKRLQATRRRDRHANSTSGHGRSVNGSQAAGIDGAGGTQGDMHGGGDGRAGSPTGFSKVWMILEVLAMGRIDGPTARRVTHVLGAYAIVSLLSVGGAMLLAWCLMVRV